MEKVNALKLRQSFGKILKNLQKGDAPLLIEKGRQPVAVLISIKTFNERFVDLREKDKRDALVALARDTAVDTETDSLTILRELRYGGRH
jgi:PHD/YefM family antitoxin component YafN of YafNO toxin-antitoxin module